VLLFIGNSLLAYQSSLSRFPANRSTVIGACLGGVVLYLAVVAGIACIWKGNRNFHGLIKVLFWFALLMLIVKLNAARQRPNALEPTATPLVGAIDSGVQTRPVISTVPAGSCGSAWVR
jgi:threonine/homoserine/homoserine lactone efflux protein